MPGLLTEEARAYLKEGCVEISFAVELEFTTGTERWWTGVYPYTPPSGKTFNGAGQFASIGDSESSQDFHANGLKLALMGLPSDAMRDLRRLRPEQYKGRPAQFYVWIRRGNTMVHEITKYFFMDIVDYSANPETGGLVQIHLETEVRRATRSEVRRYTDASQKSFDPTDRSMEKMPYLASGVEIRWGSEGAFFRNDNQ